VRLFHINGDLRMKKSLIALAALATVATAAQAQSSVTLYGIVDMGYLNVKNDGTGTYNKADSGTLSTSRWGLRGTEDLGGGMKAHFNLESEIAADTGVGGGTVVAGAGSNATSTTGTLFNRASNVSLETAVGTIQLGRMNKLEYDAVIANDVCGGCNFGGATRTGYIGSGIYRDDARYANAVVLRSAKYNGLSLAYQHQFGEQAGDAKYHSSDSVAADYTFQNLRVIATYSEDKDSMGGKYSSVKSMGANYDFGVVKVFAYDAKRDNKIDQPDTKVLSLGASAPINAKVSALVAYNRTKNQGSTSANTATVGADSNTISVGLLYAFSKRTTGYAFYGAAHNDAGATQYLAGTSARPTAGMDQKATAVGIRHTF